MESRAPIKPSVAAIALLAMIVMPAHAARMQIPSMHATLDAIPVCHDFGCKRKTTIALSAREWRSVAGWFAPAANTPHDEREQIRRAIGWMEVVVGRHTPTHKDLALDLPVDADRNALFPGQLDCIDEAVNTTTYLRLFESHGLLRHHRTMDAAYRRSLFDQHWAGQVRETKSGELFVIDSWYQPNGHLPFIQSGREWYDVGLLSAVGGDYHEAETDSNNTNANSNSNLSSAQDNARPFWRRFLRE